MLAGEVPLDGSSGAGHGAPTPDELMAHTLELEAYQREVEAQQRAAAKEARRLERDLRTLSVSPGPEAVPVPALEVTVMRVVGCDMLSNGLSGRDFAVVTHAGPGEGQALTKIGSDGNSHDQGVVRLPSEGGQQQTLTAELRVDGRSAATGTVQVSELHKVGGCEEGRGLACLLRLFALLLPPSSLRLRSCPLVSPALLPPLPARRLPTRAGSCCLTTRRPAPAPSSQPSSPACARVAPRTAAPWPG